MALGVVPDRMKNQVHFMKTDGDPRQQFTTQGMSKKEIKKLGMGFREKSFAFMGSKTAADMQKITDKSVALKQEIGFVGTIGKDKEIRLAALPVDGRNKIDQMPLEAQINENYSKTEQAGMVLFGHTHMKAYVQGWSFGDGSAMAQQKGIGDPTDPADYANHLYRSSNAGTQGRSTGLIATPFGVTVYGSTQNANKGTNNSYILYKGLK